MRKRLMRGAAIGAATTMLAGGAAFVTAGAASAAPAKPASPTTQHSPGKHDAHKRQCHKTQGHWKWVWHHGFKDHRGHWHHGFWVKVWVPGHWVCHNHR